MVILNPNESCFGAVQSYYGLKGNRTSAATYKQMEHYLSPFPDSQPKFLSSLILSSVAHNRPNKMKTEEILLHTPKSNSRLQQLSTTVVIRQQTYSENKNNKRDFYSRVSKQERSKVPQSLSSTKLRIRQQVQDCQRQSKTTEQYQDHAYAPGLTIEIRQGN